MLPALAAAGLEVLDPWLLTPEVDAALSRRARRSPTAPSRRTSLAEVDRRIGEANADLIRDADGMLAVLDGTDVDSGTAAEIGFASALGKVVVGLRTDLRRAGDNDGAIVNLQVEYFIRATGGPDRHRPRRRRRRPRPPARKARRRPLRVVNCGPWAATTGRRRGLESGFRHGRTGRDLVDLRRRRRVHGDVEGARAAGPRARAGTGPGRGGHGGAAPQPEDTRGDERAKEERRPVPVVPRAHLARGAVMRALLPTRDPVDGLARRSPLTHVETNRATQRRTIA